MRNEEDRTGSRPGNAMMVRNHILAMIGSGNLAGNGRLPTERELVISLGVSRRAVRRAIQSLEDEGLVWRRQGKGTFAGQPADPVGVLAARINGEASVMEVMEARLCIEPELAALCARRALPDEIARMRHLAHRRDVAGDPEALELWDGALHRLIAKAARNRPLMVAYAMLDEIRASADWMALRIRARSGASLSATDEQHMRVVDAIEAGDAGAARSAMRAHIDARLRAMIDALGGAED